MLDEKDVPEASPIASARSSSELLPIHDQVDEDADDEDAADGLELDERQSDEIRRIFATTLPQYLIPVEEMAEQLLAGSAGPEVGQALLGTVRSLSAAAARMGFAAMQVQLDQLAQSVEALEPWSRQALDRNVREELLGRLLDLKDLAAGLGDEPVTSPGEDARSLVKALSATDPSGTRIVEQLAREGAEDVLPRLSQAGLCTVEQLRGADPGEVAVVTGLSPAIVHRMLALLGLGAPAPGPAPAEVKGEGDEASSAPEQAKLLVLPTQPLRRELLRRLREQVEAETTLDEMRVVVHRLRSTINLERRQIHGTEESCRRLELANRQGAELLYEVSQVLEQLRTERASLCQAADEAAELLREREERLLSLRQERQRVTEEDRQVGSEVQHLIDQVDGLLRQVSRGLSPDRCRARSAQRSRSE